MRTLENKGEIENCQLPFDSMIPITTKELTPKLLGVW